MIRVTKSARRSEFLYQSVLWLVLLVVCITTLYPFVNILAKSFSSGEAMIGKRIHILPIEPTLINYHVIFIDSTLKNALLISTTRTLIGTSLHLLVICLAAYAVSKQHLRGRKFFILYFIIPMYFNGGSCPPICSSARSA